MRISNSLWRFSRRSPQLEAEPPRRWVRLVTRLPQLQGSSAAWWQPGPEDRELRRSANEFGRSPGGAPVRAPVLRGVRALADTLGVASDPVAMRWGVAVPGGLLIDVSGAAKVGSTRLQLFVEMAAPYQAGQHFDTGRLVVGPQPAVPGQ